MNFVHCLHIVLVIGKYTDVFRGIFSDEGGSGRRRYDGGSFHGGVFNGKREFSMQGVPDFPLFSKKRSEIELKKQILSIESKEQY